VLAAAGTIATQIFWVRRAYALDEQAFELNALAALQATAREVMVAQGNMPSDYHLVEQVSPAYFVAETGVPVDKATLQHYLSTHLSQRQLNTSFAFQQYDCNSGQPSYQGFVAGPGNNGANLQSLPPALPGRGTYYFAVYFPQRQQLLLTQLWPWILSSVLLLAVLAFLGYLLFILFRQKQLSEVQKNFVSNMTHEFKTPLSAIQLSADVLKNPNIVSQPQRLLSYATIISNESTQLASHVERLLEAGQHERGLKLEKQVLVWQELLEEARHTFLDNWQDKSCVPEVHLYLPETPVYFNGDGRHLKTAVLNLLDNAARYCEQQPEIAVRLTANRNAILLSVSDNGIGIPKEHQRLLFQKFYRVPTGNLHNYKGFGLGLNYVQLIAKGHGGQIRCTSETGKGSIFTLTFPLKTHRHYERKQSKHPVSGR